MATRLAARRADPEISVLGDTHRLRPEALPLAPHARPISRLSQVLAPRIIAGKYRLERVLGEGGMGTIWQAFNLQLQRRVAIKLLQPGLRCAELTERLRAEARIAAQLVHPSIVRVFDMGESEAGEPFIVMELLEGESLAQVLDRGRLSAIDVVRLLLPIAEALALAHASSVVHRDLKPDNVFIVADGPLVLPKLLDFGIAKSEEIESGFRRHRTQAGTLLGSPEYMSPEQMACLPDVDHRSDIWSFCVMLHEALAGQPPFSGDTLPALRRSIAEDEPPPLAHLGVDATLEAIVRRGLEKDRERRPASIAELGRGLASWLIEQGVWDDAAGSSLAARWLGVVRAHLPSREAPRARPITSAPNGPKTLVSEGLPTSPPAPRRRWQAALSIVAAAAALITLGLEVASNATTASAARITLGAALTSPVPTPPVPSRGLQLPERSLGDTALLAAVSFSTRVEASSFAADRVTAAAPLGAAGGKAAPAAHRPVNKPTIF